MEMLTLFIFPFINLDVLFLAILRYQNLSKGGQAVNSCFLLPL